MSTCPISTACYLPILNRARVDIVQAVGRALRPAGHKPCAYVLIPVIMQGTTGEAFVESKAFAAVLTVLRALADKRRA